MKLVPRELWTVRDALDCASLALDPRCNGGVHWPDALTPERFAPLLQAAPYPLWLFRDGEKAMTAMGETRGDAHMLHVCNRGFTRSEVVRLAAAFMDEHPGRWYCITLRPAVTRLARLLGFHEIERTEHAQLLQREG